MTCGNGPSPSGDPALETDPAPHARGACPSTRLGVSPRDHILTPATTATSPRPLLVPHTPYAIYPTGSEISREPSGMKVNQKTLLELTPSKVNTAPKI
eukprot:526903-Amphidinium_carterae.1